LNCTASGSLRPTVEIVTRGETVVEDDMSVVIRVCLGIRRAVAAQQHEQQKNE